MTDPNVVIVTGAGSGVGRAVSLMLTAMGYDVALVGRTRAKLEETVEIAGETDVNLLVLNYDITARDAVRSIVDETMEQLGRVDAVINCAAIAPMTPIDDLTPSITQQCLEINVAGTMNLTAAAWPIMKKQGSGIFVNISSLASIDPFPGFSVYAASKIAVNMFTSCVAKEGAEYGIKAVAVAPGAIETPMFRALFTEEQYPRENTLAPEDVAQVVCDCVTGGRDFQPGELIEVHSPPMK